MIRNKFVSSLLVALIISWSTNNVAFANFQVTVGSGTTLVAIDASNQGTSGCAAASTECPATVLINPAGTAVGTLSSPLQVADSSVVSAITSNLAPVGPTTSPSLAVAFTDTGTVVSTAPALGAGGQGLTGWSSQIDKDIQTLNSTISASLITPGPQTTATSLSITPASDADPCVNTAKLQAPINLTASGQLITASGSKSNYICSIDFISATAQNIALVEGTGSTCATNIFGLAGGTTAATGWNFAANGGLAKGSGAATVFTPNSDTHAGGANVCLLLSSTGQTSGSIQYVQK